MIFSSRKRTSTSRETEPPVLYGWPVSPHVRAARAAFHEKGVRIDLREIDFAALAADGYEKLQPYRKMPALTHGAVSLWETPAIMVYADGIGAGAKLEPDGAQDRALTWRWIGAVQNRLYPAGTLQLFFNVVLAPRLGMPADADASTAAVPLLAEEFDRLEAALAQGGLAGAGFSLADLYCGMMVDYVAMTPQGAALLTTRPALRRWLGDLRKRDSFKATLPDLVADLAV